VTGHTENRAENVKCSVDNSTVNISNDSFTSTQALDNYNNYSKDGALLANEPEKAILPGNHANIDLAGIMRQRLDEQSFLLERLAEDRESARAMAESLAEEARIWLIVLEIFRRIVKGDNVPKSDEDFLAANSPGLYMIAMISRQEKENPENPEPIAPNESNGHNSLYSGDSDKSDGASAPDVQKSAAATAGGGASFGE
jgi:hypothetical protein